MRYLQLFAKGYAKFFVSFYKGLTWLVMGGIVIFAMSQVSALTLIVCIALGWFIHKKYEVKTKKRANKNKKTKKV